MLGCFCISYKRVHPTHLAKGQILRNLFTFDLQECWSTGQAIYHTRTWTEIGSRRESEEMHTWNVECITNTFEYILQRWCCPSFVRICWTIKSIATSLSAPRGIITSAYFFVGWMKSSKPGLTYFAYCMSDSTVSLKNVNFPNKSKIRLLMNQEIVENRSARPD